MAYIHNALPCKQKQVLPPMLQYNSSYNNYQIPNFIHASQAAFNLSH